MNTPTPGLAGVRCALHGGATASHRKHARQLQIEQAAERFGLRVETSPEDALRDALELAEGRVRYYLARVQELPAEQLVFGAERITRTRRLPERGDDRRQAGADGMIIEDTSHAVSKPHVLVTLLDAAERHRVAVAKIMTELDIAGRRVQQSQQLGSQMHSVLMLALARGGLTGEQQRMVLGALPAAIETVAGKVLADD